MKILIADDCSTRYKNLIGILEELGIPSKSICFTTCSDDAQTKLESSYYDLLILDILIPHRIYDEDTSHQNSLDILYRINNDESINKPGKVIGITADLNAAGAARELFSQSTWSIINYSQTDTEWQKKIVNCIKYIKQQNEAKSTIDCSSSHTDIAIICALEDPEFNSIMALPWNWSASRPIHDCVFVRDGWFYSNQRKITVSATFASRMGMISTALRSHTVIEKLRPSIIAMTGICAGVKEKVAIGDVLFADPAWDFQCGKWIKPDNSDRKFQIAPHQIPASHSIRSHFEILRSNSDFLKEVSNGFEQKGEFATSLKVGPVASGSAVLADGETINEIKDQQRELIGVEMEIYGLYAAAYASSPPPKFFALKGVCDYADPDKIDKSQRYAAYASARVLQKLFEEYGYRLIG